LLLLQYIVPFNPFTPLYFVLLFNSDFFLKQLSSVFLINHYGTDINNCYAGINVEAIVIADLTRNLIRDLNHMSFSRRKDSVIAGLTRNLIQGSVK